MRTMTEAPYLVLYQTPNTGNLGSNFGGANQVTVVIATDVQEATKIVMTSYADARVASAWRLPEVVE